MALFMMQVKPVSRSKGQSAVAAAAYRSGTIIKCYREGLTHDYTRKSGILKSDSQIVLPAGVVARWALERDELWNEAERAENRKDSRVAREYVTALPKEATPQERKKLVMDLSKYIANRYHVAVDMNIHAPHRIKGETNDNYHAHLLTTTRQILPDGLGCKSEVEISDTDRGKRGLSLSKDEVKHLRCYWAELQNQVLQKYDTQVSALSLADQGFDLEPTLHMGPIDTALERKGETTRIGDYNRAVTERNLARLHNPLDLEQEIIATEQLIASLKCKIDTQIEHISVPNLSFSHTALSKEIAILFNTKYEQSDGLALLNHSEILSEIQDKQNEQTSKNKMMQVKELTKELEQGWAFDVEIDEEFKKVAKQLAELHVYQDLSIWAIVQASLGNRKFLNKNDKAILDQVNLWGLIEPEKEHIEESMPEPILDPVEDRMTYLRERNFRLREEQMARDEKLVPILQKFDKFLNVRMVDGSSMSIHAIYNAIDSIAPILEAAQQQLKSEDAFDKTHPLEVTDLFDRSTLTKLHVVLEFMIKQNLRNEIVDQFVAQLKNIESYPVTPVAHRSESKPEKNSDAPTPTMRPNFF